MSEMTSADERCQPLACSLSSDGLHERKVLIDELLARGLTRLTAIPDGVQARFVTRPGLKADLDALAELEARCCAFLTFSVADADDAIVLEVTGAPETQGLIAELFSSAAASPKSEARCQPRALARWPAAYSPDVQCDSPAGVLEGQ